jgi:hypothetical protein
MEVIDEEERYLINEDGDFHDFDEGDPDGSEEEMIDLVLVDQPELDGVIGEFTEVFRRHSPEPNGPFAEEDFDPPVFPLPDNFDQSYIICSFISFEGFP